MPTIEIDFDVFKSLTMLREAETNSYNAVIRRLLKLPANKLLAGNFERLNAGRPAVDLQGGKFPGRFGVSGKLQRTDVHGAREKWPVTVWRRSVVEPFACRPTCDKHIRRWLELLGSEGAGRYRVAQGQRTSKSLRLKLKIATRIHDLWQIVGRILNRSFAYILTRIAQTLSLTTFALTKDGKRNST